MSLAPLLPEPRSAIPANSGEGPPLFWSPESLRRRPPTWPAAGVQQGHCLVAPGARLAQLTMVNLLTGLVPAADQWLPLNELIKLVKIINLG